MRPAVFVIAVLFLPLVLPLAAQEPLNPERGSNIAGLFA